MSAFVAGLIGAGVGVLLKWVADVGTEGMRNKRQDRVWRREHYMQAAADLLSLAWELKGSHAHVAIAVFSLGNAESHSSADVVAKYRERLQVAYDRHAPLPSQANRTFELLRLYAPANVTAEARTLLDLAHETPADPRDIGPISEKIDAQATVFADIVRYHSATLT